MTEKEKADFDHPCRQTCSGWTQGRERGLQECKIIIDNLQNRSAALIKALETAGGQLGNPIITDACANACKTIRKALKEFK